MKASVDDDDDQVTMNMTDFSRESISRLLFCAYVIRFNRTNVLLIINLPFIEQNSLRFYTFMSLSIG